MRQRSRAFHFLTNVLDQGEAAPALIGTMAWMFRKLIEAQGLSPHTSPYEAARRLGMRAATAEMAMQHARKIPRRQLVRGFADTLRRGQLVKRGRDKRPGSDGVRGRATYSASGAAPGAEPRTARSSETVIDCQGLF